MKGFLRGCLVVVAIVATIFGVAGFLAYRSTRSVVDRVADAVSGAAELVKASDRVALRDPYTPPGNGELTSQQVDRFLAVQARVREALDSRWSELQAKSSALRSRLQQQGNDVGVGDVMGIFSDFTGIYVAARRAQVGALNVQKFSPAEYSWVRMRVYEAAGLQLAGSLDLSALETLIREGEARTGLRMPEVPTPQIPRANLELVAPHVGKLKEWLPMAMLGL